MNKVLVKESTLENIADAIRDKYNSYFQMLPSEMPELIDWIDTEKVTIDGQTATEKMNLYGVYNQVVLDINAPTSPSGYTYQGKLYDGSKLYMKTTLTTVKDGSSSSSAGCTGTVLLIKPNGTQLSVAIPTYTIPSRSETGSSPDSYTYSCELYLSPDNHVYLRLQRKFEDIRGSYTHDHSTYYQSIYKLNIYSSSLSWTNKVIEVTLGADKSASSDYIIEDNYMYVCSGGFTRYIYGYKFGDTTYTFQKLSTNSIDYSSIGGSDTKIFVRKGTNTYIYFWSDSSTTLTNNWIAVTRNSDGTYTSSSGTASLSKYHKSYKAFTLLNNEVYVQTLGYGDYSGYDGLHIYKLNDDNSAWDLVYSIANATSYNTEITNYLNNAPDTIFQGGGSSESPYSINSIRYDGTFDLIEFIPGTLSYSQIITPTITNMKYYETWYYSGYRRNDIGQRIFFFQVETQYEYDYITDYKCVLGEPLDGSPVLYSTFSDITWW